MYSIIYAYLLIFRCDPDSPGVSRTPLEPISLSVPRKNAAVSMLRWSNGGTASEFTPVINGHCPVINLITSHHIWYLGLYLTYQVG